MRKICISLSKGGVAKSTSAVTLAHGLALIGKRVLLIDTDEQGHSSELLGVNPKFGLSEVIAQTVDLNQALCEARKNLYLLAGSLNLAGTKRVISKKEFGAEKTLSNALKGIENVFDYVIVDTSPSWDSLTINSLFYCEEALIPVSLDVLSLNSLSEYTQRLKEVSDYKDKAIQSYILPTFADGRVKKTSEILAILNKHYSDILFEPIRYCSRIAEAPGHKQTIFEYAPNSSAAFDYKKTIHRIINEKGNT